MKKRNSQLFSFCSSISTAFHHSVSLNNHDPLPLRSFSKMSSFLPASCCILYSLPSSVAFFPLTFLIAQFKIFYSALFILHFVVSSPCWEPHTFSLSSRSHSSLSPSSLSPFLPVNTSAACRRHTY